MRACDLIIVQGETQRIGFLWLAGPDRDHLTPVDVSGCGARMQLRRTVEDDEVLAEFSTAAGTLEVVWPCGEAGQFYIVIGAEQSAAFAHSTMVYDLFASQPAGTPSRVVGGAAFLERRVPR